MLRVGQNLRRNPLFHDLAIGEDDHARGEIARKVVIVRGAWIAAGLALESNEQQATSLK